MFHSAGFLLAPCDFFIYLSYMGNGFYLSISLFFSLSLYYYYLSLPQSYPSNVPPFGWQAIARGSPSTLVFLSFLSSFFFLFLFLFLFLWVHVIVRLFLSLFFFSFGFLSSFSSLFFFFFFVSPISLIILGNWSDFRSRSVGWMGEVGAVSLGDGRTDGDGNAGLGLCG